MRTVWAVIGLAVVVMAGCSTATPQVSQTPAASASPSPVAEVSKAPSPSPSLVATAYPSSTPATLAVPDGQLHVLPAASPWATYGSLVIELMQLGVRSSGPVRLTLSDLATGRTVTLATLPKSHAVAQVAVTAERVIWVETWRNHPSPPTNSVPGCVDTGKPLRWKISALVITTGRRSVIASGTNRRTAIGGECMDVNPPDIAADDARVAYTLEAPSHSRPAANRIIVRSLVDGHPLRSITSAGLVQDLALEGQAIVYRDLTLYDPSSATVDPFDAHLMLAADDVTAPRLLDAHVNRVGLGGGRIAWSRSDATDGSLWTITLGSSAIAQLTRLVAPDLMADGIGQIAASADLIAWTVEGTIGDANTSRLAAWRVDDPAPQYVAGFAQPDYVAISVGWLVWNATLGDPAGRPRGLYGIALTALPSPWVPAHRVEEIWRVSARRASPQRRWRRRPLTTIQ